MIKTLSRICTFALCAALISAPALAVDLPKIKQSKLGLYLSAPEAAALLKSTPNKVLFIDIRTRGEAQFVGYAEPVDALVPYLEMNEFHEWDNSQNRFKLEVNGAFSQTIEKLLRAKGLTKTDKVVLICRSGDRSARAADSLAEAGFTQVYSVWDGFEGDMSPEGRRSVNGWKNAGLPWTYKSDKAKLWVPTQK
jgi:rhodanese-related sulfurtransferase